MDTSKTSSIKSLLLQAWRERWTDVRWGINIKNVLPRGVSGDVYDLADCILQEALVGPGPNNLFLSYLTHCLSAQVVSYGAVLSSIGRFQSFFKPPCILSLLQLLYSIQAKITCHGNEEECIALCKAIVGVTHWLYLCMCHSIGKIVELKQSAEHGLILEKACESLSFFSESTFLKALLYIGKHEEPAVYAQLVQKQQELETKLSQSQGFSIPKDTLEGALNLVRLVDDMPKISASSCVSGRVPKQPLVCSLNANVAIEAVLNPASDIQSTVDHLLLMKKLLNLTSAELYCEIIRAGFMGLANSSSEDLKWAAFTFLKVPQLLLKIHSARKDDRQWEEELEAGLMQLLNYSPLLDLTDSKCHCDCLQYLLNELQKVELLTETQAKALVHRRQTNTQKQNLPRPDQQTSQALILRAEPTVTSILKTLDSDYSKNQDGLLGILCHIISGKSFELILSAAAATGKLSSFVKKLIKFNEYNKQWFSDTLVRQALKHDHLEDLHRAIDLSFGLFHIDIEQCALALLTQVLPNYLLWETRQDFLTEPRGSALARLVVLSTFAALQARTNSPTLGMQRGGRKRPYWDMELEEAMDESKRMRPSKIRRGLNDSELLDDTPFALQCHSEENYRSLDPLSKAVADTMRLLMAIASDSVISQRSVFPLLLFEQIVLCAGEEAHRVLQFAPLGLVPQLVRSMPLLMSHQLILALSSLQTSRARKVTARATCQLQIARSLSSTHLT
ncbi:hypothetical protein HPB52_012186 [Rhipicephalus sanguineus]|uniref:Mediator of RNA polymerase II transcription subunit 24 n=1 Tax=Rhipicephalus sanguineus TaxID=34632 RepID=A0A9D4PPL6_RHISA|nr:hypothetical protein HPB52_012186 [Rhipicephalus sanguineus]